MKGAKIQQKKYHIYKKNFLFFHQTHLLSPGSGWNSPPRGRGTSPNSRVQILSSLPPANRRKRLSQCATYTPLARRSQKCNSRQLKCTLYEPGRGRQQPIWITQAWSAHTTTAVQFGFQQQALMDACVCRLCCSRGVHTWVEAAALRSDSVTKVAFALQLSCLLALKGLSTSSEKFRQGLGSVWSGCTVTGAFACSHTPRRVAGLLAHTVNYVWSSWGLRITVNQADRCSKMIFQSSCSCHCAFSTALLNHSVI